MIDKSKQYRTRDDREVRIYATDGIGACPVHGAIRFDAQWEANTWTDSGEYTAGRISLHDLIEVKPRIKRTVWVNVYPQSETIWISEEAANACCTDKRIACVKLTIDCEEGEGL